MDPCEALLRGKRVYYYVTHVGAFRLTEEGLLLHAVMPGIDIQLDILDRTTGRILLPQLGTVPVVDTTIVTGEGFRLKWPEKEDIEIS